MPYHTSYPIKANNILCVGEYNAWQREFESKFREDKEFLKASCYSCPSETIRAYFIEQLKECNFGSFFKQALDFVEKMGQVCQICHQLDFDELKQCIICSDPLHSRCSKVKNLCGYCEINRHHEPPSIVPQYEVMDHTDRQIDLSTALKSVKCKLLNFPKAVSKFTFPNIEPHINCPQDVIKKYKFYVGRVYDQKYKLISLMLQKKEIRAVAHRNIEFLQRDVLCEYSGLIVPQRSFTEKKKYHNVIYDAGRSTTRLYINSEKQGNISRFIAQSKCGEPNVEAKRYWIGKRFRILYFALRDIKKGEILIEANNNFEDFLEIEQGQGWGWSWGWGEISKSKWVEEGEVSDFQAQEQQSESINLIEENMTYRQIDEFSQKKKRPKIDDQS